MDAYSAYTVNQGTPLLVEPVRLANGLRKRLRKSGYIVCALALDIEGSNRLDPVVLADVKAALRMIAGTEVTARGGFVVRETDGLDALFFCPVRCLRTALALHDRRTQIRQVVETVTRGVASIDYRLVASLLDDAELKALVDRNHDDAELAKNLVDVGWARIVNRYGNRQAFLIQVDLWKHLQQRGERMLCSKFDAMYPIPFLPNKPNPDEQISLWQDGFYQYAAQTETKATVLTESDWVIRVTIEQQEERLRASQEAQAVAYADVSKGARERAELFRLFPYEPLPPQRPIRRAVVLGDLNVDYGLELDSDDVGRMCDSVTTGEHTQRQQTIERKLGGKGLLAAQELVRLGAIDAATLAVKLGADAELAFVLQALKESKSVSPRIFLSQHRATGTTLMLRVRGVQTALLTVTNSPNANEELNTDDLRSLGDDLANSDLLYVSGYCLIDGRLPAVEEAIRDASEHQRVVLLELSPGDLIASSVRKLDATRRRIAEIVGCSTVVVYEKEPFRDLEETLGLDRTPFAMKLDFKNHALSIRRRKKWFYRTTTGDAPNGRTPTGLAAVGQMSRLAAEFVGEEFLRPQILLCSESTTRFRLLSEVFGMRRVHVMLRPSQPKQPRASWCHRVASREELENELLQQVLRKLRERLEGLGEKQAELLVGCHVAIASELVVAQSASEGDSWLVLGRPDECLDPVGAAHKQLKTISNSRHEVVSVSLLCDIYGQLLYGEGLLSLLRRVDAESRRWRPDIEDGAVRVCRSEEGLLCKICARTTVAMRRLENDEIEEYLASGSWRKKAGSYDFQGAGGQFVTEVVGSRTNILGFPMREIAARLQEEFGVAPGQR